MTEPNEYVTLNFEQRGSGYALVRTHGAEKTELALLETDVLSLARIAPSYARALIATKTQPGSDISAWVAIPVQEYSLNSDLHNQLVLLRLRDETDAEFGFSFEPNGARQIADRLKAWADRVDNSTKPTRQ